MSIAFIHDQQLALIHSLLYCIPPNCCCIPPPLHIPHLQDVFSLGCVLAELFLDGQPLFDYSRLLAYRLGGAAAAGTLAALDKVHPSVRGMVAHMVQRDPAKRHSVQQYLQVCSCNYLCGWGGWGQRRLAFY